MLRTSLLMILLCSGSVLAAPLYKVVDADGNVTYTDTPPADQTTGQSEQVTQKPLNVLDKAPQDFQKSFDKNLEKRQDQRGKAWQDYDKELRAAEQALQQAQKAQKDGETVQEGDMIGVYANKRQTGVRLSEDYIGRQETLKQAVQEAEARLDAAKKQKPALHR